MFVLFLITWTIKQIDTKTFYMETYTCGSGNDGCGFAVTGDANEVKMLYIYDPQDSDYVLYRYAPSESYNMQEYNTASNAEKRQIFKSKLNVYVVFQPRSQRNIHVRAGSSYYFKCPQGTLFTTQTTFDLAEFMESYDLTVPSKFCVVFLHKTSTSEITNNMIDIDEDTYDFNEFGYRKSELEWKAITQGETIELQANDAPLYM